MMTAAATVPLTLPPDLLSKWGRSHLRETLLLLHILEVRAASLTLESL